MELQPNPLSAMELIANEPIRLVHGRKAVCDGGKSTRKARLWKKILILGGTFSPSSCFPVGSGPLGHPKIYINVVRSFTCFNPQDAHLSRTG
jgi:hypothetical protein